MTADPFGDDLVVLGGHWDKLAKEVAYGSGDGARRARGSQPPGKLSVVSLVSEVATAAREGADELAHRYTPDAMANLWLVHEALLAKPDDDLLGWWTEAVVEWTERADAILSPHKTGRLYGARCPVCGHMLAAVHQDGQLVHVPAIEVFWDEAGVRAIGCRVCGGAWLRDNNLSDLVDRTLRINLAVEVLAIG